MKFDEILSEIIKLRSIILMQKNQPDIANQLLQNGIDKEEDLKINLLSREERKEREKIYFEYKWTIFCNNLIKDIPTSELPIVQGLLQQIKDNLSTSVTKTNEIHGNVVEKFLLPIVELAYIYMKKRVLPKNMHKN